MDENITPEKSGTGSGAETSTLADSEEAKQLQDLSQLANVADQAAKKAKAEQDKDQENPGENKTPGGSETVVYDSDGTIASLLMKTSQFFARRPGWEKWAMAKDEAADMGESLAKLLAKYAPRIKPGPEAEFAADLIGYAVPRVMTEDEQAQIPENQQQAKQGSDGHQRKSQPTE